MAGEELSPEIEHELQMARLRGGIKHVLQQELEAQYGPEVAAKIIWAMEKDEQSEYTEPPETGTEL